MQDKYATHVINIKYYACQFLNARSFYGYFYMSITKNVMTLKSANALSSYAFKKNVFSIEKPHPIIKGKENEWY